MHIYEKSRPTGKVSGIMANTIELKQQIAQGEYDAAFAKLYGADAVQEQRKRYTDLIDEFEKETGIPTIKPADPFLVTPTGIAMNCKV